MFRGETRFLLGLLLAAVLAYLPWFWGPPAYDDPLVLMYPSRMAGPSEIFHSFRDPVMPLPQGHTYPSYAYRPLTEATLAFNQWLTGDSIPAMRVGNLLIHLGATLLVFALARRLGATAFARWAALFFAIHPLGVHAVTYVYQRAVGLEALLFFLTILLYWKARDDGSRWALWGGLGAGLAAMTAKEPAVTLPLVLLALEWILPRGGEDRRTVLRRWLPFACLPLLVLVQVMRASHEASGLYSAEAGQFRESVYRPTISGCTRWEYLLIQMSVVVRYGIQAFLPFPLTFYHDRTYPMPGQAMPIPLGETLLAGLILLALLAWILAGPRRQALPRFGAALFLAPLALESTVFPIQDFSFDHRCYPGLLGAGLVFAWGLSRLGRKTALALGILALGLMGDLTVFENRVWADPVPRLARDVRHAFHRVNMWGNLGWHYLNEGKVQAAEPVFRRVLRVALKDPRTRVGTACVLMSLGRMDEAREVFDRVLKACPRDSSVLWRAVGHALLTRDQARIEDLADRAEALGLVRPELALWLAGHRNEQGRPEVSEAILRRHLAFYPANAQLWDLLGWTLQMQSRFPEAEAAYRRAVDLKPALAETWMDIGVLCLARGDLKAAEENLRRALLRAPDLAEAWGHLAAALERQGRTGEAREARKRAGGKE